MPGGEWYLSHKVDGFKEPLKKIVFDTLGNLWGVHPNKGLFRLRLNNDLTQVSEYQTFAKGEGMPTDFQLDITRIGNKIFLDAHGSPLQVTGSKNRVVFEPVSTQRQKWLCGYGSDFFALDSSGIVLHSGNKTYALQLSLVPNFERIVALNAQEYLFCLENGFALLNKVNLAGLLPPAAPGCILRRLETPDGASFLPAANLTRCV